MALHIDDPEIEAKAADLAARTNRPLADVVLSALAKEEAAVQELERRASRLAAIREIQARVAAMPVLDHRTDDEILGYDENGLPS